MKKIFKTMGMVALGACLAVSVSACKDKQTDSDSSSVNSSESVQQPLTINNKPADGTLLLTATSNAYAFTTDAYEGNANGRTTAPATFGQPNPALTSSAVGTTLGAKSSVVVSPMLPVCLCTPLVNLQNWIPPTLQPLPIPA